MTPPTPARPVILEVAPDPVFAMYHAPASGAMSGTAVLVCPTWGWDDVASYRSRRAWADRLAADGHPTLRIDLPGTGDSGGAPGIEDRLGAWTRAVSAAAGWLAGQPGASRVAAIGLGLGGLVAARAIADGAPVDDLVLWGAPVQGRAFLREQRAFAGLQSSALGLTQEQIAAGLPEGWLEVGGFVLSADTMAAIQAIDLTALPTGRLQRALLLDRDGIRHDRGLEEHLREQGVVVSTAPGNGWTEMVFHPERYAPAVATFDRVAAWLDEAVPASVAMDAADPTAASDGLELIQDGVRIRETAIRIEQPFGQIFGVLAEPVDAARSDLCAIFLNAGAVRRIGPNRLWVEASRRWSARGVPMIRMDLEGIGDADGDPDRYRDVGNFYTAEFGAQVGAIIDDLERRGFGPRFVLVGLCAGGYWAFHTGASDGRIVAALIINPRAMIWDADLLSRREARKVQRLLEPALWTRIARGEVGASRMVSVSRAVAGRAAGAVVGAPARLRHRGSGEPAADAVVRLFDALSSLGTRVVLAFSSDEPVHDELAADGILARLDQWPNVVLEQLPGHDHTLRPMIAQQALHRLLDAEFERLVSAPGDR